MQLVSPPSSDVQGDSPLRCMKEKAILAFCATKDSHAYTSPLLLQRLLELHLPELSYDPDPGCPVHSMLLIEKQTYENAEQSFLSIVCADCRYHFHIKTDKSLTRAIDSNEHPSHMLIPLPPDPEEHQRKAGFAEFICATDECCYMVSISATPPKLSFEQIDKLQDDNRIRSNLQLARNEDPQRYADISDSWCAGSTIPTLIKYIEDRLTKPTGEVLKIKKRNKRFRVAFGQDFDDLLRSLGFDNQLDEEGEECWYIIEPEPVSAGQPTPANTRRAHLEDTLEELRALLPGSNTTTPAWPKLKEAFPGDERLQDVDRRPSNPVSEDDLVLLGCMKSFSPLWFSWAAIVLAKICPPRREMFLNAGLRCIQERSEDATFNITMYRSQFDHQVPSISPRVQEAFDFFGISPEDISYVDDVLEEISRKCDLLVSPDIDDSSRNEASQHRNTILQHIGPISPRNFSAARFSPFSSPAPTKRRMSIGSASRLLHVDANYTADLIRDFAANLGEDVDRAAVVEALKVLSDLKQQQDKPEEAHALAETAAFFSETGNVTTDQPHHALQPEQSSTTNPATAFATPPGLKNIGNTCYLNSLLQYFYNVKPIRDMIIEYHQNQLTLDDASVQSRRTGGSGTPVTLEEAIVAREFTEELRRLFSELQTTTSAAASPSQKLANTALSSAKEILTAQPKSEPPPLPARPSLALTAPSNKESITVTGSIEQINKLSHTASSESSQTLVNEAEDDERGAHAEAPKKDFTFIGTDQTSEASPEDRTLVHTVEHVEDITMEDASPPLSLEQKIAHISQHLEKSDRSGTSQQDVEEIIGNILEHLMRAIRPTGLINGKPDLQADRVTELFFTTIVNRTIKTMTENTGLTITSSMDEDILNEEVVPERWITAFPHPDKEHRVKNSLYDALDRYFSYELLSESRLARYTTIRALPPIVHICIQRTDASGVKNKNPVIIPEELYLDRYMEAPPGSALWRTRRRIWATRERLNELVSRGSKSVHNIFKTQGVDNLGSAHETLAHEGPLPEQQGQIDLKSDLWRDIPLASKQTSQAARNGQPANLSTFRSDLRPGSTQNGGLNFMNLLWEDGRRMDDADSWELASLREEQANAFESMKNYKYRLHAMICHGGGMNAGHYWVWVQDFKNQVWYKYNDSQVTRDSRDTNRVISEVNESGDPYYVAYVRDEWKDDLVEVPQRAKQNDEDTHMATAEDDELQVIESIVIDTPPQPANSPANTPAPEAIMDDAAPLQL
ncbi:hypothetical protein F4777DRAFT_579115 [Nemania sp. FL0916]|nr:hypothetical protein F4777DRAFT_579115 [Nemania sp. FL0916]